MYRALVLLLLLASTEARAEGAWGVTLGAGPGAYRIGTNRDFMLGASSQLDAGYRVVDSATFAAGIGAHLGIAYVRATDYGGERKTYVPFEVGLSMQLVIADRVLIVPWAGYTDLALRRHRTAGIEVGFDIFVRGRDRISAIAAFTRSPGTSSTSYDGISAGIAYRYW